MTKIYDTHKVINRLLLCVILYNTETRSSIVYHRVLLLLIAWSVTANITCERFHHQNVVHLSLVKL